MDTPQNNVPFDLETFREYVFDNIQMLLNESFETIEDVDKAEGDVLNYIRSIYELWAVGLGVVDAMACFRGVPIDLRHKISRQGFLHGKQSTLEQHRKFCASCEAGTSLEEELTSAH